MNFINSDSNGSTILSVVIASGIMSIVLASVLTTSQFIFKAERSFRQSIEVSEAKDNIRTLLQDPIACANTLAQKKPEDPRGDPDTLVNEIKNSLDENVYVVGQNNAQNTIKLSSMYVDNFILNSNGPPKEGLAHLNLIFEKTGQSIGSKKVVRKLSVFLTYDVATDSEIDTCYSAGGGGGTSGSSSTFTAYNLAEALEAPNPGGGLSAYPSWISCGNSPAGYMMLKISFYNPGTNRLRFTSLDFDPPPYVVFMANTGAFFDYGNAPLPPQMINKSIQQICSDVTCKCFD